MARRSRISQSPMAITSHGQVVVGLGYSMDLRTVAALVNVISTTSLYPGQMFFIGVVLDRRHRDDALRRLEDAAAEAAALSGVGTSKQKRVGAR